MNQVMNKSAKQGVKLNTQSDFTLIELVIVVVILGFLAVTAIPKFLDLTEQAKQANIEGMAGGFATGVSLARAQWEADARPTVGGVNRIDYDGTELFLTTPPTPNDNNIRPGYPTGIDAGNPDGTNMTVADCIDVWQGILAQPPTLTSDIDNLNDNASINYFVKLEANQCQYFLRETLNQNTDGAYETPADTTVGNNFTYNNANSSVVVNINN